MAGRTVQLWKHLRVLWCMIETFCFGGLHYGWPALVYVFKEEGFFSDNCEAHNNTAGPVSDRSLCDYQDGQLALLYSLANGFAIIPIFMCGTCISRFGAVKTRIVWTCLFALGCCMMIISSTERPWYACAGLTLFAGAGRVFLISNLQISRLYQTGTFIVLALISGSFDSSSAMMLFVKLAYEAGIGTRVSFAVILGLSMTALINTYVNFNSNVSKDEQEQRNGQDNENAEKWTLCQTYKIYLCNRMYISHFIWFTFLGTHFNFYITASNIYIGNVSDGADSSESSLTNFLSIAMFIGIVPALLVGIFLEQFQHKMEGSIYTRNMKTSIIAFITTMVLSVLLAVLSIFHHVTVAYISFIILPIFRAFLFAIAYTFIAKAFPFRAFGALSALIDVQSSVILLFQSALFKWLQAYNDAEFHIRISLLVISVISIHHPVLLLMKVRKTGKDIREADGEDTATQSGILDTNHIEERV